MRRDLGRALVFCSVVLVASIGVVGPAHSGPECLKKLPGVQQDALEWGEKANDLLSLVEKHSQINATALGLEIEAMEVKVKAVIEQDPAERDMKLARYKEILQELKDLEIERFDGSYADQWRSLMEEKARIHKALDVMLECTDLAKD